MTHPTRGACLLLLLAGSLSCTSSATVEHSSEPITTPQPTYATGLESVPAHVLRATLSELNSRVCDQGGGLARLKSAGETSLDQALLLLPDDGSLSSLSDGMTPSTQVFDMLLVGGDCRANGKTVTSVEAIVIAPEADPRVTIAQAKGSYAGVQDLKQPFGPQWDDAT